MEKKPKMSGKIIPFEEKLLKKKLGLSLSATENDVQKALEKKADDWASSFVEKGISTSYNDTDGEKTEGEMRL